MYENSAQVGEENPWIVKLRSEFLDFEEITDLHTAYDIESVWNNVSNQLVHRESVLL